MAQMSFTLTKGLKTLPELCEVNTSVPKVNGRSEEKKLPLELGKGANSCFTNPRILKKNETNSYELLT